MPSTDWLKSQINKNMNKPTSSCSHDMEQLTEDTRTLMAATADVVGEKVEEARRRLAVVLDQGKLADKVVHEHPYPAIAIGVGVGAMIGFLLARRCACPRE